MDTNICGLNKVVCRAPSSSYAGRTVTITNGVNTWSGTIANITGVGYACVFMVPSLPAPAKKTYTVTLYNSAGTSPEYQRDIELGFGDSIVIGLYTNAEIADKAYVLSEIDNHAYVLPKATSSALGGVMVPSANGLSVDVNGNVRMSVAGTSNVGVVKPGTGLSIDSTNGTLSLNIAGSSRLGGVMVNTLRGLSLSNTGLLELGEASTSNLGGIKIGKGLLRDSNAVVKVNFRRSEIEVPVSATVEAYSFVFKTVTISNSSYRTILENGIIESIKTGNADVHAVLQYCNVYSTNATLTMFLINGGNTSHTISTVDLRVCEFY